MSKFYHVAGRSFSSFGRKLSFLIICLMVVSASLQAQVSVTASAGVLGPTAYTTLKGAFDAINLGTHQGVINITITGTTTETTTAILNSSGAPSSYQSVKIRPGVGGGTVTGSIAANSIVKLYGADSVTIDGFVTSGPTRELTFSNTNTSTTSAVIWVASASVTDGALNNTIKNCNINGAGNSSTTTLACIAQSSGVTIGNFAETANSNNTYTNNSITGAQYGIGVVGLSGNEDANTMISSNLIGSTIAGSKIEHAGIFMAQQKNITITGNTIAGVNSTRGGLSFQASGIFVGGTVASGGLIENNKISDIKISGPWGANGIQLNSSTAASGLIIQNNFIFDIAGGGWTDADTVDDNGFGIAVVTGGGYSIWYNSIDLSTNEGTTTYKCAALWLASGLSAGSLNVRNNIFSIRQTIGNRWAIYSNSANTVFSAINYNDYFSASTTQLGFLTSSHANLAAWQGASGGDANSVSVDPSFTSTTDLHLTGASPLDGLATPIAGVIRDIDGDSRNATTPDIGADEFTPPNCTNPVTNNFPATASINDICASGTAVLSASGYSFGIGIQYQWEVSTTSPVAGFSNLAGQTNPVNGSTGVISSTHYYRLKVTCTLSGGSTGYSLPITITVNNPAVSSTTPGTRCGTGTVNLAAVGTNLKWYSTSSGGTAIGTGSPFTTPVISNTTTYYVSATSGGTSIVGGKSSTAGADGGYTGTDAGLVFDVLQQFVIDSVKMYPQAAGNVTIQVLTNAAVLVAQTTVTFTGATSTGVYVPLGFTIPVGTGYRMIVSSNSSSMAIWRDFTGNSYPYSLGIGGNITGGWITGAITTYYFFYDWHITTGCESTRTPVVATVTPPPAFTSVSPAAGSPRVICQGGSVTLNANGAAGGYTSYTWNPGALANGSVVSPTVNTDYTLTATTPGGCRRDSTITITVNSTPSAITISPLNASVCPTTPTAVTVTGGLIPGQTVFTETAETFPFSQWTFTNLGANPVTLNQNTTYAQQGTGSIWLVGNETFSNGALATTSSINLTNYTSPSLTFWHICGTEATSTSHYDVGFVEYSTDGGTNWFGIPAAAYLGAGTLTGGGVIGFDNTSYSDWDAQFSGPGSTPGVAPATSMWKQETINLSAYAGNANFKIRFRLNTDVSVTYYGWLIDNIRISATGQAPITWSSNANLWLNLGHTIPLTGVTDPAVYYYAPGPSGPFTYTVTATGGVGCTSTATTTMTASALSPSVSLTRSPAGAFCYGTPVTFTATAVNGGAPPAYDWKVNGVSVSGGSVVGLNVYTINNLNNGDIVRVVMSVNPNVGACVTTFKDSAQLTMTVNPLPVLSNISGATGSTVCTGAPNLLTETAGGTITTYQWYLDGSPVGANSSTYSASAPGTYTCAVTTNLGCKDTTADFVVTQPTYTITATAGPNGTISPSGAVVVNCGDDQVFTITPNPGYTIQDVLVDGVSNAGAIAAGAYTFTVVGSNHTISANFGITGCATPATATAGSNASICAGTNYTLSGASFGGSASSATWSSSGTGTFNPSNVFGTAVSYTPSAADIAAGTVDLTLTTDDPPGVCIASSSTITITIKPAPDVTITGQIGLCTAGATTTYLVADTSATTVNVTSFQWYNGALPTGTNNDSLFVNSTGTYAVTVTGSNSCTANYSVVVGIFAAPSVSISGTGPICTDATIDINATAVAGSGTVVSNGYIWYQGATLLPSATSAVLSASNAGTYTCYATNSNGCISPVSNSVALSLDNSPLNGNYTIGVGPASCTNYLSFTSAVRDLNNRSISGNVRFSVPAGYTETVINPGLVLGKPALNAATAGGFTITFLKSGVGANPKLTAYTGGTNLPTTSIPDGIFKLRGVDNVTITNIDLAENAANSGTALMEFGYGLFRYSTTDGAQNNTIQGCTITLSRLNDASAGGQMCQGSGGIIVIGAVDSNAITPITPTSVAGTNSNNKFYSNTIQSVHNGFWLSGYAAPSPFTLGDTGNDIGGLSAATGNTIINFGNSGDATATSGVTLTNQWGANVGYNTIDNNFASGGVNTTNNLRGIYGVAAVSASITISGNSINLKSGATGGQTVTGIDNTIGSTAAANTVTINNNTITGTANSATTAGWNGILNNATAANVSISANTIQNISLAGTGAFNGISSVGTVPSLTVNNNNILNNTKTASGTFNGISMGAPTVSNMVSNVVSGNILTAGGTASTMNCMITAGGAGSAYTLDANTIYNNGITGITGAVIGTVNGFFTNASVATEMLTDNTVRKLYVTGTSTGLHSIRGLSSNGVAATVRSYFRNQIDSLYTTSTISSTIWGIYSQVGATIVMTGNKIHSLFPGQSVTAGAFAKGIALLPSASGTSIKVYNNVVSLDLGQAFAPAANNVLTGANSVIGVEVAPSGAATLSIYYNTVRLSGGGSGTSFGSSGIAHTTINGTIDLRNNLVVNRMTPGGGAGSFVVALRRAQAVMTGFAATSNNNLFNTTESATNPVYYNGTAAFNTLALYQANVTPRDSLSINDLPVFVNTATNDLHLNPGSNCGIDGSAQPIATYPDDYDATNTRDLNAPDIGFDEFDGTGGSTVWKGVNTNWFDPKNWCGVVPTASSDVTIPKRFSGKYPIILTGTNALTRNITINQYASVTINTGGNMTNGGVWLNNGSLTNNGTIELNGTTTQLFPNVASTGTLTAMTNLTANNTAGVTIDKALTLLGVLKPKTGAFTLNNVAVTLHSDASSTASVDTLGGSIVYSGANAKFIVERFISSGTKVAWRFLAAPIAGTQTINQAWQEGEIAPTYTANGLGTQIVGPGGPAVGYDINNTIPSLKTYAPATNTWVAVPNTSSTPISSTQGYMLFIRGDRGSNTFGTQSFTTLRMSGPIKTGPVTVSTANANVNQFISVGNPYPCPISFNSPSTVRTGLQDVYYLWDPKVGLYGGYQTFAGGSYAPNPGGPLSSYSTGNNKIESGSAFFVVADANNAPHSITINENSKTTSANFQVQRTAGFDRTFSTRLYSGTGVNTVLYDGNRIDFDAANSNVVDDNDARKMFNYGENFGILHDGVNLAVERRADVATTDTVFFRMTQMRQIDYVLEFTSENLAGTGLTAYLEDLYLQTSTPIDLSVVNTVSFTVNADAASKAEGRFRIVFKQLAPVPVTFTSVSAHRQDRNIVVDWKVENEISIAQYEIEHSADARTFSKMATQAARGNGTGVTLQYTQLDEHPFYGVNYYRIKSIGNSGSVKFSQVVKVDMTGEPSLISVYPNPVKEDGIVKLSLTNEPAGSYNVKLLNTAGQLVATQQYNHEGGNSVYTLDLKQLSVAHGNYMLQVLEGNKVKTTLKIVY